MHLDLKINEKRRALPEYARFSLLRFEIQIRTIVQDAWSVLDHKIKYKKSIPARLKRRINALAAQFETVDHEFLAIKNESLLLEQQTTTETVKSVDKIKEPIDAFQFLAVAKQCYHGYTFAPDHVDGFVQEILHRKPGFTGSDFGTALHDFKDSVNGYKKVSPDRKSVV